MDTIVCLFFGGCDLLSERAEIGELLEKSTRTLTAEEKALLEKEWVGKNGSKRKLEVCCLPLPLELPPLG